MKRRSTFRLLLGSSLLVALGVGGVLIYAAYNHDMSVAEARVADGQLLVETPCQSIMANRGMDFQRL